MGDETRIIRWLVLPDVFQLTDDILPSVEYTVEGDETKVVKWNVSLDTWDTVLETGNNFNKCQVFCCGL